MTYCVGLLLDQGLVMASDSRTNAGVDHISSYSKMHLFQPAPDRLFVLLAAGNLATTREVVDRIRRDLDRGANPGDHQVLTHQGPTLQTANYLFEAASYVGQVGLAVTAEQGPAVRAAGASPEASFLLGGQIAGQPHGLFLVYPQGNAIAATPETPYLQIGESKFGKPVLDLIAHTGMSLEDAARLLLVSLEGTARSNLTVAPPFEVAIYPRDLLRLAQRLRLEADGPDLRALSGSWDATLRQGFAALPRFGWEQTLSNDGGQ